APSIPNAFASSGKSGLYGLPSGFRNSVPYAFLKEVVPTVRMVEKQKLLNKTHKTGTPSSTAVVSAPITDKNPPSPTRQTTFRFGAPIFAPIAAAGPKPMVASPPEVINVPGFEHCSCWAAPFLFQPTSVTNIVSSVTAFDISASRRAG